jgi:hypothetical protein
MNPAPPGAAVAQVGSLKPQPPLSPEQAAQVRATAANGLAYLINKYEGGTLTRVADPRGFIFPKTSALSSWLAIRRDYLAHFVGKYRARMLANAKVVSQHEALFPAAQWTTARRIIRRVLLGAEMGYGYDDVNPAAPISGVIPTMLKKAFGKDPLGYEDATSDALVLANWTGDLGLRDMANVWSLFLREVETGKVRESGPLTESQADVLRARRGGHVPVSSVDWPEVWEEVQKWALIAGIAGAGFLGLYVLNMVAPKQ